MLCGLKPNSRELLYLRCYLRGLQATSLIVEPRYVDWDFLSQYRVFYATSMQLITNICSRVHYFSGPVVSREIFLKALSGDKKSIEMLQKNYLGFIVIRPITNAPLGRTVLRWHEDKKKRYTPRINISSRCNRANIAGLELNVTGLCWQQQDQATSTCGSVSLWSAQLASPYKHYSSTTSEITQDAHRYYASGFRTFPSGGLKLDHIVEAIRAIRGMDACVIRGTIEITDTSIRENYGFIRYFFNCYASMFLSGGFPVLLYGEFEGRKVDHVNLMVAYRSVPPRCKESFEANAWNMQEYWLNEYYIHDDGIGPNVRCTISSAMDNDNIIPIAEKSNYIRLHYEGVGDLPAQFSCETQSSLRNCGRSSADTPSAGPKKSDKSWKDDLSEFIPTHMIVMIPEELRLVPQSFFNRSLICQFALDTWSAYMEDINQEEYPFLTFSYSLQVMSNSQYLGQVLNAVLGNNPEVLAQVRMDLMEKVSPMSKYLAVTRYSVRHPQQTDFGPFMDLLHDTSGSKLEHPIIAVVVYQRTAIEAINYIQKNPQLIVNAVHEMIGKHKMHDIIPRWAGEEYILSARVRTVRAFAEAQSDDSPSQPK